MNKDYLAFFDFRDEPFKLTPDINYYFFSKSHEFVFEHLMYFFNSNEPFAVIVGEPGIGKTITVRKFIDEINDKAEVAYILFPSLKPVELFIAILEDLKIKIPSGITKNKLFSLFRNYLIKKRQEGKKVIVVVDEAQNLPIETLEELRILSNLETENEKLIKILLVGQQELLKKIDVPELRQLKQRITILQELKPLQPVEVKEYIYFRISKADGKVKIDEDVFKLVYDYTQGYPRLINQLMDRALMAAYIDKTRRIKPEHVKRAAKTLNLTSHKVTTKYSISSKRATILIILFILVFSTGFVGWKFLYQTKAPTVSLKSLAQQQSVFSTNSKEKETQNNKKKNYVLYLYATRDINDAFKKKENIEKVIGKKTVVAKVKNGQYYAIAILYDKKEDALKDLKKVKKISGFKDAFVPPGRYNLEIIKSSSSTNSKVK